MGSFRNRNARRLRLSDYFNEVGQKNIHFFCRECRKPIIGLDRLKFLVDNIEYRPDSNSSQHMFIDMSKTPPDYYVELPEERWFIRGRTLSGKTYFRRVCWDCFFKKLPEIEDIPRRARKSSWYRDVNNGIFRPPATWSSPSKYFKYIFDITDEELEKEHQKFDTASLESFIRRHGEEEGKRKYEEYKKRQAYTCSKEYMMGEKGMTEEEWNQYNATRSSTKENFIKRYGEELGEKKWKEYCEYEAYAGCSIDYFIEKYGEEEGKRTYEYVNSQKRQTLENYTAKYGDEEGKRRYDEYWEKRGNVQGDYSEISQRLFREIDTKYPESKEKSQYATKNGEKLVVVTDRNGPRELHVDFCLENKVIEFNGNYFHADPMKYKADDVLPFLGKTAKAIWMRDMLRNNGITKLGYDIHIVWENDYRKDPEKTINECVEFLQGKKKPDFSAHDDENMWKEGVQS